MFVNYPSCDSNHENHIPEFNSLTTVETLILSYESDWALL